MVEDSEREVGLFYMYKIQRKMFEIFSSYKCLYTYNNYRMPVLKDHSISKIQKEACVENEIQKGKERDEKYAPKLVKKNIPKSSPLVQGFNQMK